MLDKVFDTPLMITLIENIAFCKTKRIKENFQRQFVNEVLAKLEAAVKQVFKTGHLKNFAKENTCVEVSI